LEIILTKKQESSNHINRPKLTCAEQNDMKSLTWLERDEGQTALLTIAALDNF